MSTEISPLTPSPGNAFLDWQETLGHFDNWTADIQRERHARFDALSPPEKQIALLGRHANEFTDENVTSETPYEELSPSGLYRLVVRHYKRGSRGEVFRVSDGVRVADVRRDLHSFHHFWMEDGDDFHYLVSGDDYQGQSFCNLLTGEKHIYIPEEAFDGAGFCWSDGQLLPRTPDGKRTLLVDGCYWGGPFWYFFFDVTDPSKGWPELLPPEDVRCCLDVELLNDITSEVNAEGQLIVRWNESLYLDRETRKPIDSMAVYRQHQNPPESWELFLDKTITLRRDGDELVFAENGLWVSDRAAQAEARRDAQHAAGKAERQHWVDTDPLFLSLVAHVGRPVAAGFSYPSGKMRDEGDKNPAYFRINLPPWNFSADQPHHVSSDRRVEITWGITDGKITFEGRSRLKGPDEGDLDMKSARSAENLALVWDLAQTYLTSGLRAAWAQVDTDPRIERESSASPAASATESP